MCKRGPNPIAAKASAAKAADGDEPVFAYIASLPQPQRAIADLDDRPAVSWMKQAAAIPFFGAKKR